MTNIILIIFSLALPTVVGGKTAKRVAAEGEVTIFSIIIDTKGKEACGEVIKINDDKHLHMPFNDQTFVWKVAIQRNISGFIPKNPEDEDMGEDQIATTTAPVGSCSPRNTGREVRSHLKSRVTFFFILINLTDTFTISPGMGVLLKEQFVWSWGR